VDYREKKKKKAQEEAVFSLRTIFVEKSALARKKKRKGEGGGWRPSKDPFEEGKEKNLSRKDTVCPISSYFSYCTPN